MDELRVTWVQLKALQELKNLPFQYDLDGEGNFYVFIVEEGICWSSTLVVGSADALDFQTNFQSTANVALKQNIQLFDSNGNPITSTGNGLDVNIKSSATLESINSGIQTLNSLVPTVYDYISLAYTGNDLTTAIFKIGGAGGTTVSTLTLVYSMGNLVSVTKS